MMLLVSDNSVRGRAYLSFAAIVSSDFWRDSRLSSYICNSVHFSHTEHCDLMVHSVNSSRYSEGVCRSLNSGFKIESLQSIKLVSNIFFNLCKACQVTAMASIPPSAFSAGRIRETQRDMKVSNIKQGKDPKSKVFNTNFMELSPLKYNSKLMNSIWGFYNRYSPHNVKKVNDALSFNGELQQTAANSPNKSEPVISLPAAKLDNVWAAINVSQSH